MRKLNALTNQIHFSSLEFLNIYYNKWKVNIAQNHFVLIYFINSENSIAVVDDF